MKLKILKEVKNGKTTYWVCKRILLFFYVHIGDGGEYPEACHDSLEKAIAYMNDYKSKNYMKWVS